MQDLTIRVKLDKSAADAAAAAHLENLKKIGKAHQANADTAKRADREALTELQTLERAKQQVIAETSRKAVTAAKEAVAGEKAKSEAARLAADAQKRAAKEITEGINESKAAGNSFAATLTGLVGIAGGLSIIGQAGQAMANTMKSAREEADRLAERFIQQRDTLREIAAISGGQANNAAVLQNAAFNSATGMRPEESRGFVTEFLNAGSQNIGAGKSLSAGEAEKFKTMAGQFAVAKGVDPTTMGNLAGSTLGFQNFQAKGQGANEAQNSLARAFAVMEAGQGNGSVMARQLQMLSASTVNEDQYKGIFRSPEEAGIAVSVGAEKHDASAAEMVKATARGIYATQGKEAEFLQAAGVGKDDDFFARIQKISDYTKSNANDKGIRTSDFLGESFTDQLTKEGLEVFVNRGVQGGVIANRRGVLAANNGPDAGQKAFADAAADPDGAVRQRIVEARNSEADAKRASERTSLVQLGIEADTAITDAGSRDSVGQSVVGGIYNSVGLPFQKLGLIPGFEESRRRKAMGMILDQKRGAVGLPPQGNYDTNDPRAALGYGGTLTGAGEDQALIKSLDELNKRIQENTKVQAVKNPQVPPQLRAAPPVVTR